jgi:hypothetical protein
MYMYLLVRDKSASETCYVSGKQINNSFAGDLVVPLVFEGLLPDYRIDSRGVLELLEPRLSEVSTQSRRSQQQTSGLLIV